MILRSRVLRSEGVSHGSLSSLSPSPPSGICLGSIFGSDFLVSGSELSVSSSSSLATFDSSKSSLKDKMQEGQLTTFLFPCKIYDCTLLVHHAQCLVHSYMITMNKKLHKTVWPNHRGRFRTLMQRLFRLTKMLTGRQTDKDIINP